MVEKIMSEVQIHTEFQGPNVLTDYLQSCGTEGRGQGNWKCKQEVLPELNSWRTSQIRTKIAPIHYDPCSTMLVSGKTFRMLD